jgi:hypothetical protein
MAIEDIAMLILAEAPIKTGFITPKNILKAV